LPQAPALQFGQVIINEPPVSEKEGVAYDIYTKRRMPNGDEGDSQQRNVRSLFSIKDFMPSPGQVDWKELRNVKNSSRTSVFLTSFPQLMIIEA